MALKSSNFIQTLINSGADASLNLFEVTFQPKGTPDGMEEDDITTLKESFSARITQIPNLLQRDNTTSEISYQNISIPILNVGTNITRSLGFSIRIDDSYYIYDRLRKLQSLDIYGNITKDKNKLVDITVTTLKPQATAYTENDYYSTYQWKFYDCYITSVSALTFDYSSTSTGSTSVTFIWKYSEEGLLTEAEETASRVATINSNLEIYNQARHMGRPQTRIDLAEERFYTMKDSLADRL